MAQSLDMNGFDLEPGENTASADVPEVAAPETQPAQELSPAVQRFQSCRWRKAAENGTPEHCTHRDVQPMAGTAGFSADSWCVDCGHYKIRRNPRKRPAPAEDRYYY
jgi:hypothetical protein